MQLFFRNTGRIQILWITGLDQRRLDQKKLTDKKGRQAGKAEIYVGCRFIEGRTYTYRRYMQIDKTYRTTLSIAAADIRRKIRH